MKLSQGAGLTHCQRCGILAHGEAGDPAAKPFRKAMRGLCTACAVCLFFQGDENEGIGFALPAGFDPEGLRLPHIQNLFARVLAAGHSELKIEQIDWDEVVSKWALPFPVKARRAGGGR